LTSEVIGIRSSQSRSADEGEGALLNPVLAALFDLSHPARYLHWHFFQMSVANVVVILLMIVVFLAAILLRFPRRERLP
jgi:hypothetical protein